MTVAGQTSVTYGYDNANRLTSITQGSATVSLTYDNANRRSTLTYPNGIVATYGYDNANQLTSLTYTLGMTTLGDLTYTYDAAGRRTSVGGSWARTGIPSALTSAIYDAANRIATWSGTSFTYDLNGNLTSDGTTSYTWNARNQLTALSGGSIASFQYDGTGRRRGKTVSSTTTNFFYDGPNLVQELTGGGTPTANLLMGLGIDETLTRTDTGGTSTLLPDALGSPLALANTSGVVQSTYTYDPFGGTTASGASSTNPSQFTGRENDGTGLTFLRARYYSAQLQRFVSEDPLGPAGGVNVFAYTANAPTMYTDALGLKPGSGFGAPPGPGSSGGRGPGAPSGPNGSGGPAGSGGPSSAQGAGPAPPLNCLSASCLNDWFDRHPGSRPPIVAGAPPLAGTSSLIGLLPEGIQAVLAEIGLYPTKIGAGGQPQYYNPSNGQYVSDLAPLQSAVGQFIEGTVQGYAGSQGVPTPPPLTPAAGWGQALGTAAGNFISFLNP
jgi:RHS repeat-associated protein